MSETFFRTVKLEIIICGHCGITFALPADHIAAMQRERGSFYCPNGHYRGWKESDADRLRKQLAEKENELRASKCESLRQSQLKDYEAAARLKADRKLRRVQKGVCPCCTRSFTNLKRHIENKHPELDTTKQAGIKSI